MTCLSCGHSHPDTYSFCPSCRFPQRKVAGKYRLEKLLQKGGMGSIYLAHHTGLSKDTERAIKVLRNLPDAEEETRERFLREVEMTASLSQRNDHIVRIYDDFGEEYVGLFYVMEYLRGQTLSNVLKHPPSSVQQPGLPASLALSIFSQICNALAASHREGVVHRDLKPDNIMLIERDGNPHFVKVLDFGIARSLQTSAQKVPLTQGALGTPFYMSPEQIQSEEATERSDIYALGLILYEMLAGRLPYQFDKQRLEQGDFLHVFLAHLQQEPLPLQTLRPDLPEALVATVHKTLHKDPAQRTQSVQAVYEAITYGMIQSGINLSSHPSPTPPQGQPYLALPTADAEAWKEKPPAEQAPPSSHPSTLTLSQRLFPPTPHASWWKWSSAVLVVCSSVLFGLTLRPLLWDQTPPFAARNVPPVRPQHQPQKKPAQRRVVAPERDKLKSAPQRRNTPDSQVKRRKRPPIRKQPNLRRKQAPKRRVRSARRRRQRPRLRTTRFRKPRYLSRCGKSRSGYRWVAAMLGQPQNKKVHRLMFLGCAGCRWVRRSGRYCLSLPKAKSVKVRVFVNGALTCLHTIQPAQRRLRWSLRPAGLDALADERYPCAK
ncbi:MAG: serine/threonine protein kinase [Deltaproteobacteria bacterium]|nr:MAG: serine/threonine protein kinase [Deltaproteobacteria bacterium]